MRLGDLDALKNIEYINKGNFNTVEGIREWIDNAPTVEVPTYTDLIEANKEGYNNARRLYERPHGEWVEVIDYSDEYEKRWHYECSKCRNIPYYGGDIGTLHFCPNCGADMRGDT